MQELPPNALTPFVFSDPAGKRWPRLRLTLLILGVLVFLGSVLFVQTLFVAPKMRVPFSLRQLKGQLKSLQRANPASQIAPASLLWQKFGAAKQAAKKLAGITPTPAPPAKPRKKAPPNEVRLAYYTNGDPYSYTSLEEHAGLITHLCPEWITVVNGSGDIQIDADSRLPKFCANKGIALMPLLTNLVGDTWQPEAIENLAHGPTDRQERFFAKVVTVLRDAKAKGVVIDWEQIDPVYKKDITTFIDKFCDALHNDDKELWLTVQPGQDIDYIDFDELSDNVDRFVASLFDETSDVDPPGPLGSRSWFEGWLHVLLEGSDSKQWIIAVGGYGYDWTVGGKKAELISFAEAMSRAKNAEIDSAEVTGPGYNPYFYFEDGDKEHAVWFLDVITFLNQLREVRDQKAGGFALYRLGTEDPAIWDALAVSRDFKIDNQTREQLEILKGTDTITDVGEGEIVTVDESRADGMRKLAVDGEGYLTAKYTKFPEFPTLYHQGAGGEHQVAITFDDGPDPDWTPQILDILKAANVKAAFFLVGVNAERYPGLVRRIVNEGHEIGNHTYYHPNLALAWPEHVRLELNATQLLIETITGRATTLFRPPYAADTQPSSVSELMPLQIAQELNYLVVLENIDPQDWAKPGADIIVQRVKQQRRDGSIILLHDAGGDRSQTVEALPRILDWLRTRGDTIVPLSTLLGTSRDAVMPLLQTSNPSLNRLVSSTGFQIYHALEEFLWAFMIVATALVVIRTLIVIWLAYRFRPLPRHDFTKPISIVVAAYNEGKVIAGTLRSLLATDYKGELEVIVVDDGSRDETAAEVERVANVDPRVRLLRQENRGKARALQRALATVRTGIVVFVDADTHFQRDTLPFLVEPFADEGVGAVSGHAKVGNLRTFIARCQSLEYTCGFNLDRRAYTRWNCITVVPGAISAIRKSVIDQAGGLSLQTLAEDTDLTLALHKDRQRIVYVPQAIGWTEAPESVRTLAKQRFRWAYGTLQCLWKHRDMVFNWNYRALGWFSLPSVWFFQIILVAVTPVVDLFLLASLPFGAWRAVLPFVITFLSMDVILATLACILEKDPVSRAWRILPMRLIYRPMLSYCIWKAILRAIKGAWVSWGKLERTASVPVRA
ncbi:MAG TPA: glycosyltransferase [Chthoniobacterales bacterium]|jgi:cellulose synthase/poly-beta-1,6-N-acetylglucosamine synthase-like glycosyltransferase/peptidoglycan/xylan/chitin deacetylase (PgdA/CDA1 family)/spore germination protein YaaH|nr:glycosyltransferase [Chthoniobacterales bacterium]